MHPRTLSLLLFALVKSTETVHFSYTWHISELLKCIIIVAHI